jgi:hypothetical protein
MNRIERLVGAQTRYTYRFYGLFACIIALTTLTGVGAGAQISVLSLRGADRQIVSAEDRAAPRLIDPGFESFTPARAPIDGWYSDELTYEGNERSGLVRMTPDATDKVEGKYSLRIEQPRVRPSNRGQAFLAQAVRFPAQWKGTRRFDLSAQMRGLNGTVLIHVYVWEKNNVARVIAERKLTVTRVWSIATLKFDVPRGYDTFGVWFYLSRDEETQIWLDDVRLRPREN